MHRSFFRSKIAELEVLAEGAMDSDTKFASGSRYMRTTTSVIITDHRQRFAPHENPALMG